MDDVWKKALARRKEALLRREQQAEKDLFSKYYGAEYEPPPDDFGGGGKVKTYVLKNSKGGIRKIEQVTERGGTITPIGEQKRTFRQGRRMPVQRTYIGEGKPRKRGGSVSIIPENITQQKYEHADPIPGIRGSGGMVPAGEMETVPNVVSPAEDAFLRPTQVLAGEAMSGLFSLGMMENPFVTSGMVSPTEKEEVPMIAREATKFTASLPTFGLATDATVGGLKLLAKTSPVEAISGAVSGAVKKVAEPVINKLTPTAKNVQRRIRRFFDKNPDGPTIEEFVRIRTGGRAIGEEEKVRLAQEAKALGYELSGTRAIDLERALVRNQASIDAGQGGLKTTLKDAETFSQFVVRRLSPTRVGAGGDGLAVSETQLRKAGEDALKRGFIVPEATGAEVRSLLNTDLDLISQGAKGVGRKQIPGLGGEIVDVRLPSTTRSYLTAFARMMSDDTANITANMKAIGSVPMDRMKNPVEYLKWSRGVNGRIQQALTNDFGKIISPIKELESADKLVMEKFRRYVVARRGIEKQAQLSAKIVKKGRIPKGTEATGETVASMKQTVKRLDSELFRKQHGEIVKLAHRNLDELVAGEMVSAKTAAAIKSSNREYVPFYREDPKGIGIKERLFGKTGSGTTSGRPMRFSGSELEILDPLVATAQQMIGYTRAAQANLAKLNLADWAVAHASKGSGLFMRKVPQKTAKIKLNAKQIEDQLADIGYRGVEANTDATLELFTKVVGDLEKDQMLVWRGGVPEVWEFTRAGKPMMEAFTAAGHRREGAGILLAPFEMSSRMLRLGATGMNPTFTYKNLIRDLQTRQIQTAAKLGEDGKALAGMIEHVKSLITEKDLSVLMKSDIPNFTKSVAKQFGLEGAYQKFLDAGGGMSSLMALDKKGFDAALNKIAGTGGVKSFARNSIDGFRDVLALSENISRFTEYQLQMRRYLSSGMSFKDASFHALRDAQEVTLNFMTSGTIGKVVNRYVPFFNAQVRDITKIAQLMKERPDVVVSRVMQQVTMPSVALWNINKDDERYKALPDWEKDVYWHIPKKLFGFDDPADPFVRFPRPFFWGYIGGRSVEEMLEIARGSDDPRTVENLKNTMLKAFIPPYSLPLLDMLISNTGEQGWKSFFERPVISKREAKRPPHQQKDSRTSATSVFAAELGRPNTTLTSPDSMNRFERIYRSPKFLDNAIYTQFAGLSRHMLRLSDFAGKALQRSGVAKGSRAFQAAFAPKDKEAKDFLGFMEQTLKSIDDTIRFKGDPKKSTFGLDFNLVNRFYALKDEGEKVREQLYETLQNDPERYEQELNLPDTKRRLIIDHTINGRLQVQSELSAKNRKIKNETGKNLGLGSGISKALKDVPTMSARVSDTLEKWRDLREQGKHEDAERVATGLNRALIMYENMLKKRLKEEEDKNL